MRVLIEVGGWEHECCGAAFDRNAIVKVTCLRLPGASPSSTRLVESHHELTTNAKTVTYKGRVADIAILHPDGSVDAIHRPPSGRALRGFDEDDDGHLELPWNGQPVTKDSDQFLHPANLSLGRAKAAVLRMTVGLRAPHDARLNAEIA